MSKPVNDDKLPPQRWNHCMTTNNDDTVYMFGGYKNGGKYYDDLWKLKLNLNDVNESKWVVMKTGNEIKSRCSGGMTFYDNKLYVYFGSVGYELYLNDIIYLDINDNMWYNIYIKNSPKMAYFTSHNYGNDIIIFGGKTQSNQLSNKLYKLNIINKTMDRIIINDNNIELKPRWYHASSIVNDKLLIFGGCDSNWFVYDDGLFIVDLVDGYKLSHIKVKLQPMYDHFMISYSNNLMFIGGKNKDGKMSPKVILYKDIKNVKDIDKYRIKNNPDMNVACCLVNGCKLDNRLVLFGGMNTSNQATNETFYISIDTDNNNDNNNNTITDNTDTKSVETDDDLLGKYKSLETTLIARDNTIKSLNDTIVKLQTDLKNASKFNDNNNTDNKDDVKVDDSDSDKSFKLWYDIEFRAFKDVYPLIVKSGYNFIEVFIEMEPDDISLLNLKLAKKKVFTKKINTIKKDYNTFKEYLDDLHMSEYHDILTKNGIYYFKIFYKEFKTLHHLSKLINNRSDAKKIFENTPKFQNNISNSSNNIAKPDTKRIEGSDGMTQRFHG